MIEVKIEKGDHVLYQNGERFGFCYKTIITQDERHHMTNFCYVEAWYYLDLLPYHHAKPIIDKDGDLFTPSGQHKLEIDSFEFLPQRENEERIVIIKCESVLK